jgi:hypothetical protein
MCIAWFFAIYCCVKTVIVEHDALRGGDFDPLPLKNSIKSTLSSQFLSLRRISAGSKEQNSPANYQEEESSDSFQPGIRIYKSSSLFLGWASRLHFSN